LKKFLAAVFLSLGVALSLLYLAVNSPVVVDRIARRYAPKYRFDYEAVYGNPLKGLEVEGLSYRGRLLARRVRIRINPYELLRGKISFTRLQIFAADPTVAERIVRDFSADSENIKSADTRSGFSVPLAFGFRNIRITLLPFERYGIGISKAELELRSLDYDGSLHLGTFRQTARTSLGVLEARGSLSGNTLDLKYLSLERLDLERIEKILNRLAGPERKRQKEAHAQNADDNTASGGTLLPRRIRIRRLELGTLPRRYDGDIRLNSSRLVATELKADLVKRRFEDGKITAELNTSLAQIRLAGTLENRSFLLDPGSQSRIRLAEEFFRVLKIPCRAEAFTPIRLEGGVDEKGVQMRLAFSARNFLKKEGTDLYPLEINSSLSDVRYRFEDGTLTLEHHSVLSTPCAARIDLNASLGMRSGKDLRYRGVLSADRIRCVPAEVAEASGRPRVTFEGNATRISAHLQAGIFEGNFTSRDMKKGTLHLGTSKPFFPARYIRLPGKLGETSVGMNLDLPIDLRTPLPLKADLALRSNLVDLNGTIRYDGRISAEFLQKISADSLLKKFDSRFRPEALGPAKIFLTQKEKSWRLKLRSRLIRADMLYTPKNGGMKGKAEFAASKLDFRRSPDTNGSMTLTLRTRSVKKTFNVFSSFYRIDPPNLDGDLFLRVKMRKPFRKIAFELRSGKFIPDDTARIKNPIENIRLNATADFGRRTLKIERYAFRAGGMKFFSERSSVVREENGRMVFDPIWINDTLAITGVYDTNKQAGKLKAKAKRFAIEHKNAHILSAVDLKAEIRKKRITLDGKVTLLGGTVNYNLEAKHYATDDDIVIMQHRVKKEESFFRKNLRMDLLVESRKPLVFKEKNVYVRLDPRLKVFKEPDSDLQLLGSVVLEKEGYYIFEGKKFLLDESRINFTGKPTQPLLDINLRYHRHARKIAISISGTATEPNLNFSSTPYMTRDQILSLILFDTVDAGENAGDMLSLVGGGLAKSILGNIGLKVDTLILGQSGVRLGKKISDKVTILYDLKEESRIIVQVQHSRHTETDISIGSDSQSADIVYTREF